MDEKQELRKIQSAHSRENEFEKGEIKLQAENDNEDLIEFEEKQEIVEMTPPASEQPVLRYNNDEKQVVIPNKDSEENKSSIHELQE